MKAVQVLFDEHLLGQLDATEEVREKGRSAVLRRIAQEYLEHQERQRIDEQYLRAYQDRGNLDEELSGWAEQGVWPER